MSLKALINATPAAGEQVTISGIKINLRPVTVVEMLRLTKRFPSLGDLIFGASEGDDVSGGDVIKALVQEGPNAIAAIIAIAGGEKGDEEVEAGLLERPDDELFGLLEAVIDITMPKGFSDFFGRFLSLGAKLGLVNPANDVDGEEKAA